MKTLLSSILILLLALHPLAPAAQQLVLSTSSKKAIKQYQFAETAFKQQNLIEAEAYLLKALRHDPAFIEAWLLIGDVYRDLGNPESALESFNQAIAIDSAFFPRVYYFTGNLYYQIGDYEEAVSQYACFLRIIPESSPLREKVLMAYQAAHFADSALRNPVAVNPLNAGEALNSSHDDYINFIGVGQDELVMTRKIEVAKDQYGRQIYSEHFYSSTYVDKSWQLPDSLKLAWSEGLNLGGMNMSVDGRKMYFTGCNWPGGYGSCDLYVSYRDGETWDKPSNMGTLVNSQWWDSQPFISANGKQLLFASKRSGGKGNTDIWMSVRLPGGKWSMPINLGDSINTQGSEMAPFLHPDGKTLFFSSNGHHGLGGYDLFISRKDETGRWSKARNVGYPVNSRENEINMVVDLKGRSAWISSDREGGQGKTDIYQVVIYPEIKPHEVSFINGLVLDELTKQPVSAFVELSNLQTGMNEDSTFSSKTGGEFLMVVQKGINYAFNISAKGYVLYSENYNYSGPEFLDPVDKVFYLKPIAKGSRLTLKNVYFDVDSDRLSASSFVELNKLHGMLEENPSMTLIIEGHTDNTGDEDYNQSLSDGRAKAVYDYLVARGTEPGRLEWKGYGSASPVNSNTTEDGRARNRRTEIVIR